MESRRTWLLGHWLSASSGVPGVYFGLISSYTYTIYTCWSDARHWQPLDAFSTSRQHRQPPGQDFLHQHGCELTTNPKTNKQTPIPEAEASDRPKCHSLLSLLEKYEMTSRGELASPNDLLSAQRCRRYIFNEPPRIIYESFLSPAVFRRLTLRSCDMINHPSKMLCVPL